ncbi:MAG: LysR family transcriptional regulator [Liquorilactobacillus ghanensis]|jgi:DNA-binding transcriptional LysR family regulator|uniref:LysR family transcriptional regulator n=1 Tax=Liquorilactobacillus ghanensis TaxID=399370 RepID=UPI0039E73EDD
MRLQQLKYLEKIVDCGSINVAAKELFLTQPSLSKAIKELEAEMGIQILLRQQRGVSLTNDGREFMAYANQILDQVSLLDQKYKKQVLRKQLFSVSAQHYAFVVHAFVELIKNVNTEEFQFTLQETETENIIKDLASFKSELGVLYVNRFNEKVLKNLFRDNSLEFHPLFHVKPHVFVSRDNPLTQKKSLKLADLSDYPYLSYEQGDNNSFYFEEEILSNRNYKMNVKVSDRATIFNLMVGINGYTISSGIISSDLNDDKIVSIPLDVNEVSTIGWLKHKQLELSPIAQMYLEFLKEHIRKYHFQILNTD